MTMQYVRLWLDDTNSRARNGWRSYLVLPGGRKWVRLVNVEEAEAITIGVREAGEVLAKAKPMTFKRTRVARRLRANAKSYGTEDNRAVRDALALLR